MKYQTILMAASLLSAAPLAHGFSLGFAANLGVTLPPDLIVNVPGYGDVLFSAAIGSALPVTADYAFPSVIFDNGEAVTVTFLGATPSDVEFGFSGVSVGEAFTPTQLTNSQYYVSFQGSSNGAGLNSITWGTNSIPEPASSLLGGLGALMLFRRRR